MKIFYRNILLINLTILILLGLGFGCNKESNIVGSLESPHWFLGNSPAPSSATIQAIIDSIIPGIVVPLRPYYGCQEPGSWKIDTVGEWNKHKVIDLFCKLKCPEWRNKEDSFTYSAIKAIAIETSPYKYRLLYAKSSEPGNYYYESSHLIKVEGTDILYTRSQQSGTGCFFDEEQWIWDKEYNIPVSLRYGQSNDTLIDIMPPGHEIWKGSGFNINMLSYSSYTWREGDGNCCPSGGKVTTKYKIVKNQIMVKKSVFNFADRDVLARSGARSTKDSLYDKQPSIMQEPSLKVNLSNDINWLYMSAFNKIYYVTSPAAQDLVSIINNFVKGAINHILQCQPPNFYSHWTLDTIGTIQSHPVTRIKYIYNCYSWPSEYVKAIVIEINESKMRPIYINFADSTEYNAGQDTILKLSGMPIIAIAGHNRYNKKAIYNYWIWDSKKNLPISLYKDWVLNETLSLFSPKWIPKDHFIIPDKGKWDFCNLSYESDVWRQGDLDDEPGGGKLKIQFGVADKRLVPMQFKYDPPDSTLSSK